MDPARGSAAAAPPRAARDARSPAPVPKVFMPKRFAIRTRHAIPLALALCALSVSGVASASAATTRFASPGGSTAPSACTDAAAPCALPVALAAAAGGDVISLADGTYDVAAIALPRMALHWNATDKSTRPVLTSAANSTLFLSGDQSGSSFDGLEIDNTSSNGVDVSMDSNLDA